MPTSQSSDDAAFMAAPMVSVLPASMTPEPPTTQSENQGTPLTLTWRWPPGLLGLSLFNFLLRLVTLGIYHFWGKAEVRRRLWSAIRINGEPLTYTGTGGELFFGFLIVTLIVYLPFALLVLGVMILLGQDSVAFDVMTTLIYIPIMVAYGIAIYRAARYRLLRTRWRGIRGTLTGHSGYYGWTFFWTLVAAVLTLGWAIPWRSTKLQSIQTSNTRLGDRPLRFTATSGPLYVPFAIAWFWCLIICLLATIPTYFVVRRTMEEFMTTGEAVRLPPFAIATIVAIATLALLLIVIIATWYRARVINHFANHTHYEQAKFSSRITARGLIWITVINYQIALAGIFIVGSLVAGTGWITYHALGGPAMNGQTELLFIRTLPILGLLVLGLGYSLFSPITQARSISYLVRNLTITGTAPLAEIRQTTGADAKYGEGLAQAFDVDAF